MHQKVSFIAFLLHKLKQTHKSTSLHYIASEFVPGNLSGWLTRHWCLLNTDSKNKK
jgi:hypothetical protein